MRLGLIAERVPRRIITRDESKQPVRNPNPTGGPGERIVREVGQAADEVGQGRDEEVEKQEECPKSRAVKTKVGVGCRHGLTADEGITWC